MINAIELYGTLILTLIGFIVPILTILLSLFPQGTKSLALKYQNERRHSEENIATESKKAETEKGIDYKALKKTLKSLEKNRNQADLKLKYLQPNNFILRTTFPFGIAFSAVLISLFQTSIIIIVILLVSSLAAFVAGLMTLFVSLSVLFEVGEIVNKAKDSNEEKMIELLSILVEKSGIDNLYLKEKDIQVEFEKRVLKENDQISFSVNTKHSIPISIHNNGDKMAKNLEVGLIFPKDVLIEKNSTQSLFVDTSEQIIRFNKDMVQAHEDNVQSDLQITFLKSEKIKIKIFIKGENVKYQKFSFTLNIVK